MTTSNKIHSSIVPVSRRGLTNEEQQWVKEIAVANPLWADAHFGELFVVAECNCGCRTIVFEEPPFVQNPKVATHQDVVGTMNIRIKTEDGEDVISMLLHHAWGKLTHLEVIWYNFPEPVPKTWVEVGRVVRSAW